jgi:hypothetical protein
MPAEIVGHLIRRGIRAGVGCMKEVQNHPASDNGKGAMQNLEKRLKSPQAIITFAITAVVFLILTSAIEYAIRIVAINLAAVEDTQPNGAIKLPLGPADDLAKSPLLDNYDGEVEERAGQTTKPITSSIRGTFKHLSSIAGRRSRWRGLHYGIFYTVIFSLFNVLFAGILSFIPILGFAIARLGAAALTCNLHAAWTHSTIAMPTKKAFFQRFLPRKTATHLLLPTTRLHVGLLAMQLATAGAANFAHRAVTHRGINLLTASTFLLPIFVFLMIAFAHVIPSQIALIRAEASLLPAEESAVVPLDRTFGGRIAWEGFSSRRAYVFHNLTIRGAFMTFDKATFKRVVKMTVQLYMILTAITVVFFAIGAAEFWALAGKQAKEAAQFVHFNF